MPIGLLAVIGPSRKLHLGPPAFWARSRPNVCRSRHPSRISYSWATKSGFDSTGRNIRPRGRIGRGGGGVCGWGDGAAGRAGAEPVSAAACILPAMHEPEGARPRTRSPFAAALLFLIFLGIAHLYAAAPLWPQ